ncbi:MAG: hypothetical protein GX804_06480, partial [Lentisphaerae bacterium]|nr:hypothetical protein [Lentisphaerota bacterium]
IDSYSEGPVEIYNPTNPEDRRKLVDHVARATEIATALPSVDFYNKGDSGNVLGILSDAFRIKSNQNTSADTIIYTGENNNHAAEILISGLENRLGKKQLAAAGIQVLNTVIGKMSGIVTDEAQIREQNLVEIAPGTCSAFLVESFNKILISKIKLKGFVRGIKVFEEKEDLLPFEEAKLYGHNAAHALLGFLLREKGAGLMSDAGSFKNTIEFVRRAFLYESGGALCKKYKGLDPLFTSAGFELYAEDLIKRMVNPYLRDSIIRVTRDIRRKLAWDDRIAGAMRLCLENGITPQHYAHGAAAAIRILAQEENVEPSIILNTLWNDVENNQKIVSEIKNLINIKNL